MAKKVAVIKLDRRNKLIIYKKFVFTNAQFIVISKCRYLFLFWMKSSVAADEVNSIGGLVFFTFKTLEVAEQFADKIKASY